MKNKLVEKLLKTSNEIFKNKKPKADYIHLGNEYIQQMANEEGVAFEVMVKTIENKLKL